MLCRFVTRIGRQCLSRLGETFVAFVIHGDADKAVARLTVINAGIDAGNISTSIEFKKMMLEEMGSFRLLDKFLASEGVTKEELKRNPGVDRIRDGYGSKIPELLTLMSAAPDADLP